MHLSVIALSPKTKRLTLSQNVWTMLFPFILSHPQLMERPQTSQDTASQPSRVFPLYGISRTMNFDLASRDPLCQFKVESIGKSRNETASANNDNVLQQSCTLIDVQLED